MGRGNFDGREGDFRPPVASGTGLPSHSTASAHMATGNFRGLIGRTAHCSVRHASALPELRPLTGGYRISSKPSSLLRCASGTVAALAPIGRLPRGQRFHGWRIGWLRGDVVGWNADDIGLLSCRQADHDQSESRLARCAFHWNAAGHTTHDGIDTSAPEDAHMADDRPSAARTASDASEACTSAVTMRRRPVSHATAARALVSRHGQEPVQPRSTPERNCHSDRNARDRL